MIASAQNKSQKTQPSNTPKTAHAKQPPQKKVIYLLLSPLLLLPPLSLSESLS